MLTKTKIKTMINECIQEALSPNNYTLSEILSLMLLSNNKQSVINNKRNTLIKLFTANNLTLNNHFSDLYNLHRLNALYTYIKTLSLSSNTKKKYINYLNEFIITANSIHTNI